MVPGLIFGENRWNKRKLWILLLLLAGLFGVVWFLTHLEPGATLKRPTEWPPQGTARDQVRRLLSIGTPGHCTAIIGLNKEPRYPGLARVVQWFGKQPAWRVRYLRGMTADTLRTLGLARRSNLVFFSNPDHIAGVNNVAAASVSHLMALQWMLRTGCSSIAVFEDDTSLDLLPFWDKPVAELAKGLRPPDRVALQLELKLDAFHLQNGGSGDLKLEQLPLNCTDRYWIQHRDLITWGAGAYLMSRAGARRLLQKFGDGDRIDVSMVMSKSSAPDAHMLFSHDDTMFLWPPYAMEWSSSSSVAWTSGEQNWHKNVHHASALVAISVNIRQAAACSFRGYDQYRQAMEHSFPGL
jgi:hypothetical protein